MRRDLRLMLEIDLNGRTVTLDDESVRWVVARCRVESGRSSACRDLAVILERRLARDPAAMAARRPLVLSRYEARTLESLLALHRSAA